MQWKCQETKSLKIKKVEKSTMLPLSDGLSLRIRRLSLTRSSELKGEEDKMVKSSGGKSLFNTFVQFTFNSITLKCYLELTYGPKSTFFTVPSRHSLSSSQFKHGDIIEHHYQHIVAAVQSAHMSNLHRNSPFGSRQLNGQRVQRSSEGCDFDPLVTRQVSGDHKAEKLSLLPYQPIDNILPRFQTGLRLRPRISPNLVELALAPYLYKVTLVRPWQGARGEKHVLYCCATISSSK